MSDAQYTLLGLPVSFFFLLLFLTVIGFLILTFFVSYLCSKYKCCSFRSEGATMGEDAVQQDEDEKPPSYDEAMQADPSSFSSTQDVFTVLPKYCDVVVHCCHTGVKEFVPDASFESSGEFESSEEIDQRTSSNSQENLLYTKH